MIVIPTPELDSPAARALRMEGVQCQEFPCIHDTDYGVLFTTFWNNAREVGSPFVICEWDVIPWPGAVQGLIDCDQPYCVHRYPCGGNLAISFGFAKYRPTGPADPSWAQTEWRLLDGFVVPVLNRLFGRPHVHEPPVAHARREPEGAIQR